MNSVLKLLVLPLLFLFAQLSVALAQNATSEAQFDGIYEVRISRIWIDSYWSGRNDPAYRPGKTNLIQAAMIEVRNNKARFLKLEANNALAGPVFSNFKGRVNKDGVFRFSVTVNKLLGAGKNSPFTVRPSVQLSARPKVGNIATVKPKGFDEAFQAHISVKTLELFANPNPKLASKAKPQRVASSGGNEKLRTVIQPLLSELGYYNGDIDGLSGPQTRRAIKAFERVTVGPDNGILDDKELAKLVAQAEAKRNRAYKSAADTSTQSETEKLASQIQEQQLAQANALRETLGISAAKQPTDSEDAKPLEKLAAENERLRLELENAKLRQQIANLKQQLHSNTDVDPAAEQPKALKQVVIEKTKREKLEAETVEQKRLAQREAIAPKLAAAWFNDFDGQVALSADKSVAFTCASPEVGFLGPTLEVFFDTPVPLQGKQELSFSFDEGQTLEWDESYGAELYVGTLEDPYGTANAQGYAARLSFGTHRAATGSWVWLAERFMENDSVVITVNGVDLPPISLLGSSEALEHIAYFLPPCAIDASLNDEVGQTANGNSVEAAANIFDGLYRPRGAEFSHWDCESVGQDGGALGIRGNKLTLIEEACTLSNPTENKGTSEVAFDAQCAIEGSEYNAKYSFRKTNFGVVFSGDGFSAEWQSCAAPDNLQKKFSNERNEPEVSPGDAGALELVAQWHQANGRCRGDSGNAQATLDWCEIRSSIGQVLEGMSWCHGQDSSASFEESWRECSGSQSELTDGQRVAAEEAENEWLAAEQAELENLVRKHEKLLPRDVDLKGSCEDQKNSACGKLAAKNSKVFTMVYTCPTAVPLANEALQALGKKKIDTKALFVHINSQVAESGFDGFTPLVNSELKELMMRDPGAVKRTLILCLSGLKSGKMDLERFEGAYLELERLAEKRAERKRFEVAQPERKRQSSGILIVDCVELGDWAAGMARQNNLLVNDPARLQEQYLYNFDMWNRNTRIDEISRSNLLMAASRAFRGTIHDDIAFEQEIKQLCLSSRMGFSNPKRN